MKKYEYREIAVNDDASTGPALSQLGAEGWKVVQLVSLHAREWLLEREVQEEPVPPNEPAETFTGYRRRAVQAEERVKQLEAVLEKQLELCCDASHTCKPCPDKVKAIQEALS